MELTAEQQKELIGMQKMINSGQGWLMEGSYGRALMANIESGLLMLGPDRVRDYWGSIVPSRDDVKSGTKGSKQFVATKFGKKWANKLAKVDF